MYNTRVLSSPGRPPCHFLVHPWGPPKGSLEAPRQKNVYFVVYLIEKTTLFRGPPSWVKIGGPEDPPKWASQRTHVFSLLCCILAYSVVFWRILAYFTVSYVFLAYYRVCVCFLLVFSVKFASIIKIYVFYAPLGSSVLLCSIILCFALLCSVIFRYAPLYYVMSC